MHLRKKHYINRLGMIIILISILVVFSLYRLNKKTMPLIIHYGEVQAKKLSSLVISKSITNEDINNIDFENLFIINENTCILKVRKKSNSINWRYYDFRRKSCSRYWRN